MKTMEVIDETSYLQLGQVNEGQFTSINMKDTDVTAFAEWPTKENPVPYKFNSIYLELSHSTEVYERSTYSLLEWLGDVGGLYDGLGLLSNFLLVPLSHFVLKARLLSSVFKVQESRENLYSIGHQKIEHFSYLSTMICR